MSRVSGVMYRVSPPPDLQARAPEVIEGERWCEAEGCEVKLSRYNPDPTCFVHTKPKPFHPKRRRG